VRERLMCVRDLVKDHRVMGKKEKWLIRWGRVSRPRRQGVVL